MSTDFILVMPSGNGTPRLHGVILEDQTSLTLAEVGRACAVDSEMVLALIDEGIFSPHSPVPPGPDSALWRFSGLHLHRAKVAVRLHHDLGVNLAGAALALQLMDELQALRQAVSAGQAPNAEHS